jgi:hypothetical protein
MYVCCLLISVETYRFYLFWIRLRTERSASDVDDRICEIEQGTIIEKEKDEEREGREC